MLEKAVFRTQTSKMELFEKSLAISAKVSILGVRLGSEYTYEREEATTPRFFVLSVFFIYFIIAFPCFNLCFVSQLLHREKTTCILEIKFFSKVSFKTFMLLIKLGKLKKYIENTKSVSFPEASGLQFYLKRDSSTGVFL